MVLIKWVKPRPRDVGGVFVQRVWSFFDQRWVLWSLEMEGSAGLMMALDGRLQKRWRMTRDMACCCSWLTKPVAVRPCIFQIHQDTSRSARGGAGSFTRKKTYKAETNIGIHCENVPFPCPIHFPTHCVFLMTGKSLPLLWTCETFVAMREATRRFQNAK